MPNQGRGLQSMPYVHSIGCLCVTMPSVLSLLNKLKKTLSLSTSKLVVVGVLAHYGCRRIIQVNAAHWWWLRRSPPSQCKTL